MKNLIAFLTLIIFSGNLMGSEPPINNKKVYAFSGLKLRVSPGLDTEVLTVIPYGESVKLLEKTELHESIEWMSGHWVKVQYGDVSGYIFDGFISDLPVPQHGFEMTKNDLDLTYPLIAWSEYHFDELTDGDTINYEQSEIFHQNLEYGHTLTRKDTPYSFKVTLTLEDTDLAAAYNLLRSLLKTEAERLTFDNKTIFVADNDEYIDRISIKLDQPVLIKELSDSRVSITVSDYQYGCDIRG